MIQEISARRNFRIETGIELKVDFVELTEKRVAFWGASLWNHVLWARFSVVYILVQAVQSINSDFYSKHGKKRKRLTGV